MRLMLERYSRKVLVLPVSVVILGMLYDMAMMKFLRMMMLFSSRLKSPKLMESVESQSVLTSMVYVVPETVLL